MLNITMDKTLQWEEKNGSYYGYICHRCVALVRRYDENTEWSATIKGISYNKYYGEFEDAIQYVEDYFKHQE